MGPILVLNVGILSTQLGGSNMTSSPMEEGRTEHGLIFVIEEVVTSIDIKLWTHDIYGINSSIIHIVVPIGATNVVVASIYIVCMGIGLESVCYSPS